MKNRIRDRVRMYHVSVTGLMVRLEFKRRVLKEAEYLLRQLEHLGSYARLRRHVDDVLPQQAQRKRNICVEILDTFFEESDQDLTDRLRLFLRDLIVQGLEEFDKSVDQIMGDSRLACGMVGVRELRKYAKYDLGLRACQTPEACCGIVAFFTDAGMDLRGILHVLTAVDDKEKSREIADTQRFLEDYLRDPGAVNPSYAVREIPAGFSPGNPAWRPWGAGSAAKSRCSHDLAY